MQENELKTFFANKKIVLMGVGNTQRGDDSFGPALATKLLKHPHIKSIVCEELPENYTDVVKKEKPAVIIFADVLDFGGEAGETVFLKDKSALSDRFSSHRPSLKLVMDYLEYETGAETMILGVQPSQIEYHEEMSPQIKHSMNSIYGFLNSIDFSAYKELN